MVWWLNLAREPLPRGIGSPSSARRRRPHAKDSLVSGLGFRALGFRVCRRSGGATLGPLALRRYDAPPRPLLRQDGQAKRRG